MVSYLLFLPLIISTIIAVWLAYYAWPRRTAPGAVTIFFQSLAAALWLIGYALEVAVATLSYKIIWAKVQYLGIVLLPVMIFVFALQYRGQDVWRKRRFMGLLLLIPLVTLALVWTNELHLLVWKQVSVDFSGIFPILKFEYGPAFWVHLTYSYLLVMTASIILLIAFLRSRGVYKKQSLIILLGALAPWVGNILYLIKPAWLNNLDMTPFAFTITGLFYSWGQFRFQLLDLAPIARDAIIENMSDAVIVLDMNSRIVDINPAARVFVHSSSNGQVIGESLENVFSSQQNIVATYRAHQDSLHMHTEVFLKEPGDQRLFDLRISPIYDRRGLLTARMIVLRDISERWRAEKAVQKARDELELRVNERTAEIQASNLLLQQEISERKSIAEALTYRMNLEEMITGISTTFINLEASETDQAINHSLQLISEFVQVDRGYVYLFSENGVIMQMTHGWYSPQVEQQGKYLEEIDVNHFPWWTGKLNRLEHIKISTLRDLPAEAEVEKAVLEAQNVQSLVAVPLVSSGSMVGFLGFDTVLRAHPKGWLHEDITLLIMLGEVFVNALERQRSAEQLKTSLREKELLLKEIHHRVKNNLQIISSLLNLSAGRIEDPASRRAFKESQYRIHSMALIHEKLYRSKDLARICFKEYIGNLASFLFSSYHIDTSIIRMDLDVQEVYLNIDTAIPCGLILNELVSNALRYAFLSGEPGEVGIHFYQKGERDYCLEVKDSGPGLHFDQTNLPTKSLGLILVKTLVDQLHGSLEIDSQNGARFLIRFPIPGDTL